MSDLLKINVNDHTERKNGLTYLSWAWAWAEVLKIDPQATWEAIEFNGFPASFAPDGSALVKTVVSIKGHSKSCWLPVMNHRNQAIKNPDAFAINTAIVRCLTKCISMHGLGLYIYAGEDLPEEEQEARIKPVKHSPVADVVLDDDSAARVQEIVTDMVIAFDAGRELEIIELAAMLTDSEEKIYAWKLLAPHSKIRALIKANTKQTATA
jgi:hypothetical protein